MSGRADALLAWYRGRTRPIPWRGDHDPYRILVGEVMAQQTQASRVGPHYRRFVERFPSAASLAAAPLSDVLELWDGLGYNSRAKRLRDAARVIDERGWPTDLTELPGVGEYTAAAVACFALGEHRPVVDTNVRRVLGRWRGRVLDGDGIREAGEELRQPAAEWNQALMDLGALVCTGRDPKCGECPVVAWCAGPDAYRPPRPQTPYEGSRRQARAAVLMRLARSGPATPEELALSTGLADERVGDALRSLCAEGLTTETAIGRFVTVD